MGQRRVVEKHRYRAHIPGKKSVTKVKVLGGVEFTEEQYEIVSKIVGTTFILSFILGALIF